MKKEKLRVKGIILDLDGTLVDSRQAYFEATRKAFSLLGQKTFDLNTVTEIPRRFEQHVPLDELLPGINVKEFGETYLKEYYHATFAKTKLFPHVSMAMGRLSKKTKIALVTQRCVSKETIVKQLRRFGISKYFQAVVTGTDTNSPKPSPEGVIQCSTKLDVRIYDCAVVGDSTVDIQAGKKAGAKTVAVLSGIFSYEELHKQQPDLILENVRELPDFIE